MAPSGSSGWVLVNTVMELNPKKKYGNFFTNRGTMAFSRWTVFIVFSLFIDAFLSKSYYIA